MSSTHFKLQFNDEPTDWYAWTGKRADKYLFVSIPKRTVADLFGNMNSEQITNVFGCNTNVAACVDGGSPMYLTCYHSKNTQKEDNKKLQMQPDIW